MITTSILQKREYKKHTTEVTKIKTEFGTATLLKDGYYQITTCKEGNKGKLLHRLIYEKYYGEIPEDCHIHHKDGNRSNNLINNLECLNKSKHLSLHMKDKPKSLEHRNKMSKLRKGRKYSAKARVNMSKSKNTSGFYRVSKIKKSNSKQGFIWVYRYYENGKRQWISSVDIEKLEQKVKARELPWIKYNERGE